MKKYANSEHTREALINAAGELAAEMGFPNVSTRAVAERAGENIGSIHYHFGGKDQLFEAVVRQVITRGRSLTIEQVIEPFSDTLTEPEGQTEAIRAMVRREISILFDPKFPHWHTRVIYQLMQYRNPMQELLKTELINPFIDAIDRIVAAIRPDMPPRERFIVASLLYSPIISHADYISIYLERLDDEYYTPDYLQKLEDMIVRQTTLLLDIQAPQPQKHHTKPAP
ncbi:MULTISPECIES: TetR/AcrR family transcriptional regulator [Prosthecochloris]|uniref:TetR/AcrR family transcriptional regulator n=1 Tax=Prosthecochloris vibrioformis TaxID=1098 RepID=A0A5C4RXK8_PROVB|nr:MULTISPECIES: TetR/AcrR family transcriptional regulator [Prosthecochloris]ANT65245.1 putative DNA-binding transcriptional regulator [Prosthecochloris sp. CIB 2401]TNJ36023.1 TetR/AcrR family transcriptional regulator [Prosthecochloris vibrioformis]